MVDLIEEMFRNEMELKPESPWWTRTHARKRGKTDGGQGSEDFDLLGCRLKRIGRYEVGSSLEEVGQTLGSKLPTFTEAKEPL